MVNSKHFWMASNWFDDVDKTSTAYLKCSLRCGVKNAYKLQLFHIELDSHFYNCSEEEVWRCVILLDLYICLEEATSSGMGISWSPGFYFCLHSVGIFQIWAKDYQSVHSQYSLISLYLARWQDLGVLPTSAGQCIKHCMVSFGMRSLCVRDCKFYVLGLRLSRFHYVAWLSDDFILVSSDALYCSRFW